MTSFDHDADPDAGPVAGRARLRVTLRNLRTFKSLRNPVYRLFFAASLGQMAAMSMQMLARVLLIYDLTGSGTILGAIAIANAVPMLLLSLVGGMLADRFQKKHVVMAGYVLSGLAAAAVALALTSGYLGAEREGSWWVLMAASVFQGAITGLTMPSRESMIREIVPPEGLLNAISLNTMGMNALRLLAPALTGVLVDVLGYEAVYFTMTGLYVVASVLMWLLPRTSRVATGTGSGLAGIREGFRYLRREITVLLVLVFVLVSIALSQPYSLLMPIFGAEVLNIDATGIGLLLSVSGGGAIVGSLVLASLPDRKRGLMLLASGLLLSMALIAFSFSSQLSISLGVIVFVGLGQAGVMTLAGALIQYYVDPRYLGRVMSILMMQFGFISFGVFAAGVLAESVGVQWAVGGFAMAMGIFALLAIVFVPRIRKLE